MKPNNRKVASVDVADGVATYVVTIRPSRFRLWLRKWLLKNDVWELKVKKVKQVDL